MVKEIDWDDPNIWDYEETPPILEGSKVTLRSIERNELKYHLVKTIQGRAYGDDFNKILISLDMAQSMMGKTIGDKFKFRGVEYEVIEVI